MLLKDCPVGSVVKLVSFCGRTNYNIDYFRGKFVVFEYNGVNCINDGEDCIRDDLYDDKDYQFEIVSQPNTFNNHAHQITLDGVTYKLTPITERKKIEIDGVEYYMEEM